MAEPKPFASLSASLLASKGAARPAMRRQAQLPDSSHSHQTHGHEDLGWNDMGYDVNPHGETLAHTHPVHHGLSPMVTSPHSPDASVRRDLDRAADSIGPCANVQPLNEAVGQPVQHAVPEVHLQQQAIEQVWIEPVERSPEGEAPAAVPLSTVRKAPAARARAGSRGNFAFTLRLDPQRHLRLRLASAASSLSTQQILIALVDDYLSNHPEIDAFAAGLPTTKRATPI